MNSFAINIRKITLYEIMYDQLLEMRTLCLHTLDPVEMLHPLSYVIIFENSIMHHGISVSVANDVLSIILVVLCSVVLDTRERTNGLFRQREVLFIYSRAECVEARSAGRCN